ncbi:MAG: phage tail tube protein [Bacteroidales bacterium]|jgi:TP901-1 family phage major tail protein|nr:phage tail tube protein [Bacteroidales bacterium]
MATTVHEGKNLRLKIDGKHVFHETNATITIEREVETITLDSKDSTAAWNEKRAKGLNWTASGDSLLCKTDELNAQDFAALFDQLIESDEAAQKVPVVFEIDKSQTLSGNAILQSLNPSGGIDGYATFSFNLEGTGALARADVV